MTLPRSDREFYHKLQWLMLLRIVFTTLLLGSTIVFQLRTTPSPIAIPILILYGLIATIFLLSFLYAVLLKLTDLKRLFAFIQIGIDTLVVSTIIFMTGGFSSIFSFLYLVVVIYASIFFFRRGSIIIAALCSIQYGIIIDLEYFGVLIPFGIEKGLTAPHFVGYQVLYKIVITMAACFTVAFLSSLLSEQDRKSKRELAAMTAHVNRVKRLAAMGEMAAGIAHEIKNPLASLSGAIQLLLEEPEARPEHTQLMGIIRREAGRLSQLVNDFLMFARPPSGKTEPLELEGALREIVGLFEKDAACSKRIQIRAEYLRNMWVAIDPAHLRQILWNLLINSVEAIQDQGEIGLQMFAARAKRVGIRISDNGCGISPEILPSIFDPFFTTKPQGTGLGLSIVHTILESYGSRLDVESGPQGGARFWFLLQRINPPR